MYALIDQNNKVADVQESQFPVNPALKWIDCDNSVKIGFNYHPDTQTFVDPSAKDLSIDDYKLALKEHLNLKAAEKNYDNELSIVSYKDSINTTWAEEAQAFIAWRDSCWLYALSVLTQVQNKEIEPPAIADFIAIAPVLNWN